MAMSIETFIATNSISHSSQSAECWLCYLSGGALTLTQEEGGRKEKERMLNVRALLGKAPHPQILLRRNPQ